MDAGAWLLLAFFGWLVWLAVRRYRRARMPQDKAGVRVTITTDDDTPVDGGEQEWGELRIASTQRFKDERAAALSAAPAYLLEYIDADGVITERGVTPTSWPGNATRTNMWCHLRRDWRTFRYDRMHRIVRADTGELLQPRELRDVIQGRTAAELAAARAATPPRGALSEDAEECWQTYGDVLTLLAVMGKMDGRFVAKERAVIRDFIVARGHAEDTAEALLNRLRRIQVPSPSGIDALLARIAAEAGDALRRDTVALCESTATADGKLGPEEQALLERIDRQLATVHAG